MTDKHPLLDWLALQPKSLVPLSPADAEREAIVRYLRALANSPFTVGSDRLLHEHLADHIERGDHLTAAAQGPAATSEPR